MKKFLHSLLVSLMFSALLAFTPSHPCRNIFQKKTLLKDSSNTIETTAIVIPEKAKSWPEVTWQAASKASVKVKEVKRSAEEYLALPASQYSVLAAEQIQRLSDTEFKCTIGTLNFFGNKITPVLYVTVNVIPEQVRSEIIVTKAEVEGGESAQLVNGTFSIYAANIVTVGKDEQGRKTLNSDTSLKINARIPSNRIPLGVVRSGGNFILQQSLNIVVPTFVRILSADFKRWSAGDDQRTAVEGARLEV